MANGLTLGITVGASVGAAVAGIKSVKSSLDVLDKASANLAKRQKMLGQTLENPLRMTRSRVGELKREYDQLGRAIAKIDAKRTDVALLQQKRQQHYDKRNSFKDEILGAATAAGSIAVPVKLAVEFESSMADVRKVIDFDTPQQFKEMEQDILRLTRTIPMAGSELAKIAASGGQLGIARKDISSFTETIAKMSVAFDMSAEQAGESMAKLANVYQIPITQIGKLGDAINHLSNSSPAKASEIVNALGRVGGVAKQFGLTELQTASLSSAFIALGRTPEVAGTAINGMLTKLMTADKQGKKFQAVLEGMGTDSKALKKAITENGEQALIDFLKQIEKLPKENQMGALVDLFGLEYADDVAALVGGLDTYKKSIEELKKTGKGGTPEFMGSMEKEFAARSATTANNWQLLKNGLVEIGITIGSVLLPALNQGMNAIKPLVNGFADWAAKNPEFANSLFYVVAGLASLKAGSFVFRFLGNEIGGLMTSFRLAKTLLGADWMATVLRFKSGVGFLAKGFGLLKTVFSVFGSGIMSVLRFLPMLASGFLKLGMALMANPIFLALGLLAVAAYLLYNNWSEVVGGAKALWQSLVTFFSGLWAKITAFFSSGIGNIAETILNFSPLGLFYQAFAGVMSWFGVTLPSTFSGFGRMLIQGLINGIKSAAAAVYNTIASIGNSIKAKFQAVMDIHSPSREFRRFGGFITQGLDIGIRRTASRPIGTIGTWAGRLKDSFTNRVGQLRADVAARVSGHRADFEQARQAASATGGVTIHFNPTINAPGGNPAQIQTALQMGLREFETLFQRMMADHERRAF